jgi:hypothetical protein
LVCNNFNHSHYCPSYKNNALKGASASAVNQQPTKQLLFSSDELNLLGKSLEVCKYFIGKNQNLYENPEEHSKRINYCK